MSTGWENHEPAPMELFHDWRTDKTHKTTIEIDGSIFNKLIAKAKTETYAKYPKQVSADAILKKEI